ncbi:SKP1-like protein 1A [Elaeis guineensis]|uniref:SKP1-like protein n=1 Tax=Elaeis guineensis var. tenera TaxID=51953 RepID=A0A6I9R5R5_ELAGV|nr:SKP1-like protein 1 [Elaeis guineensis]
MASAAEIEKKIVLRSSDGVEFEVEEPTARQSKLIGNMIDDGCAENTIPLFNVDAKTLDKVIEYCRKHAGTTSALGECHNTDKEIESWDAAYIDVDQTILYDILLAANYLDIKALLDLGCEQVANMMKAKRAEEIRKIFKIKNDFTPEEEEKIQMEYPWAFN